MLNSIYFFTLPFQKKGKINKVLILEINNLKKNLPLIYTKLIAIH